MPVWNLIKLGPKHGFNVEMQTITTYADQQRAAAAGDADVATTGINMPAIIASNGTTNLRIIAGQQWGGQNLIVAKGVAIDDWKDLEGKKIGVAPGTYARVLFLIAAEQHGVDLDKVDLTNIEAAGATALQALQRKELDGIVLFSPTIDTAVVDGYAVYPANVDIGDVEFGDANG
jgi:ABC-type nitrate/sulfonate/bicarbonate transport system substrate-binding protein